MTVSDPRLEGRTSLALAKPLQDTIVVVTGKFIASEGSVSLVEESGVELGGLGRVWQRIRSRPVTANGIRPPFCVLMAGLPGSGKTTLARALAVRGFVRLCPDEEMYRRHGVYGVDFPRGTFPTLERPVLEEIAIELGKQLQVGQDVVVDHGFWTPEDRALWRSIATDSGAISVVIYLEASHEELWSRVSKRNAQHEDDPNAIYFTESDLLRYRTRFISPDVQESYLLYRGDPDSVLKALQSEYKRQ